nr:restriction endonuclease subunit R [Candidatus Sigynarchaeota archaeon]
FIMLDSDEVLSVKEPKPEYLASIDWYTLDQLKKMVGKEGETFYSEEMTVKTRFGEYRVTGALFTAESYNEYLARLVDAITSNISKIGVRSRKNFPVMQIQHPTLVKIIDEFIRRRLFKQDFDPFVDENWRILMLSKQGIVKHILEQISEIIYDMQKNVNIEDAVVRKHFFSEVDSLKMRERYSLPIAKTIYERLPYPSVKGGFEKEFMLFCDTDSKTEAFVKINEHYHDFAHLKYIRSDGLLASYSPDFLVKAGGTLYVVETKATKDVKNPDVVQKQRAATDWVKKINELKPEGRGGCEWKYVLLSEKAFYSMRELGADVIEILEHTQITVEQAWGKLF